MHIEFAMFKKTIILPIAVIVLALSSCDGAKQPKELFEEQQSGVCMVLNSYYYRIALPDGTVWYCSGIDEEGDLDNLTLDEDEAKKNRVMSTGTGFFIDNKGTLLTNRHVVSPAISEEVIKKATKTLIGQIKDYFQYEQSQYAQQYNELEQAKSDCYSTDFYGNYYIDQQKYSQIEEAQQQLADNFYKAQNAVNTIDDMDMALIRVISVNEIGIAYNDTYVTKIEDFTEKNPCVATKVSDDEKTDLALIQLKNKTTPQDKHIFTIRGYNDEKSEGVLEKIKDVFVADGNEELQVDQELIMIGFNAGLVLGNTKQGIQVQMTTGKVSQHPDGDRVLYSIPTLKGSSGSPVIDRYGYVRAVNFAKLTGTDTFNFGIPEKRIIKFLKQ